VRIVIFQRMALKSALENDKGNPTRKHLHPFDKEAYKRRKIIERAFSRLKDWRRVATRNDKLAGNFTATVILTILAIW
jgi:putative transposase